MNSKYILAFITICIAISGHAQSFDDAVYLQKINKDLPHKFKSIKTGATLEAVREQKVVKIYMLIDDIEQYDEVLVERGDELQPNYGQCKEIHIEKGKYKNNYIEITDQYPLSSKMSNTYRIKTITSEGIMRMYPPVSLITEAEEHARK
jgi:hypothetical protein